MKLEGHILDSLGRALRMSIPAVMAAQLAIAQNAPLAFQSAGPMLNEFGQLLPGTESAGARVEILTAPAGIYPPGVDGEPHPSNSVLWVTHVGAGVASGGLDSGLVSGALVLDRSKPTKLFARVFNRETSALSSFYGDSAIYTNPTAEYGMFWFSLNATTQALDAADDDADGLNNSWEKSLGSEKTNPDTDGDGVSDGDEFRAGTGILDENSYLAMVTIRSGPAGQIVAEWDSVVGKVYQLQHAVIPDGGIDYVFSNVNTAVNATGVVAATTVTNLPFGVFRVRLVE